MDHGDLNAPQRRPHRSLAWIRPLLALAAGLGCGTQEASPPELRSLPPLPAAPEEAAVPRSVERTPRTLRIALVGEVRGEIEPCGCPTLPYGGFERRGALLSRLSEGGVPVFHLDAGELLLKGRTTTRGRDPARRASLLMSLSSEVGVDAWAPGPSDMLVLGADGLDGLASGVRPGPLALSSALRRPDGSAPLPASTVLEAGGVRLGVIGLTPALQGRALREVLSTAPLAASVQEALEALPADLDLVVGLGAVTDQQADDLAAAVPDLDLMLTTRGESVDPPRTPHPDGPLIVESPDRGRYLQVVDLRLGTDRNAPLVALPDASTWRKIETVRRQVAQADALDSPALDNHRQTLAVLERRFDEDGRGRNLVWVHALPLGEDLDPAGFQAPQREAGRATLADQIALYKQDTLEAAQAAAAAPPPPQTDAYASSGGCVTCHAQEFARWAYSDHAEKAWLSLVKKDATDNPECVACHSTGFGKPGGFGELTEANFRKWKAVQCEACHGPLAGHPDNPEVRGHPVTKETCTSCHDEANSPDFDYATWLPRASCQAPVAPL